MDVKVTKTKYPGWNDYPVYHCKTPTEYRELSAWMRKNRVEEFLLSSGSAGYTFQVRSNHIWFAIRWM